MMYDDENKVYNAPPWWMYVIFGIFCVWSLVIYHTSKISVPPKYYLIYVFIGFVASIIWIEFISNFLVDILTMFGIVLDIKVSYLGFTALAMGNSLGDLVANMAVSRKGFAKMAITGCFAGPLFNVVIGLGATSLKFILTAEGTNIFNYKDKDA